jgi:hypothetical protein
VKLVYFDSKKHQNNKWVNVEKHSGIHVLHFTSNDVPVSVGSYSFEIPRVCVVRIMRSPLTYMFSITYRPLVWLIGSLVHLVLIRVTSHAPPLVPPATPLGSFCLSCLLSLLGCLGSPLESLCVPLALFGMPCRLLRRILLKLTFQSLQPKGRAGRAVWKRPLWIRIEGANECIFDHICMCIYICIYTHVNKHLWTLVHFCTMYFNRFE